MTMLFSPKAWDTLQVHGDNVREKYGCEWYDNGKTIGVTLDTSADGGTLSFVMGDASDNQSVAYSQLYTDLDPEADGVVRLYPAMGVGCLSENVYTANFQPSIRSAFAQPV